MAFGCLHKGASDMKVQIISWPIIQENQEILGILKALAVEDQWHPQQLVIEVEVEVCHESKGGEEVLYQRLWITDELKIHLFLIQFSDLLF